MTWRNSSILIGAPILAAALLTAPYAVADLRTGYVSVHNAPYLYFGGNEFYRTGSDANPKALYRVSSKGGPSSEFWNSEYYYGKLDISPNGSLITLIQYIPQAANQFATGSTRLVLLSMDSEVVREIQDVWQYDWDETGERLAYITGTPNEDRGFESNGVWILNLKTGRSEKILDSANDLNWSSYNNNLFLREWKTILQYDGKHIAVAELPSLFVSPTGRYSYSDGPPFQLFDLQSGEEITKDCYPVRHFDDTSYFRPYRWLKDDRILFSSPIPRDETVFLFDVPSRKAYRVCPSNGFAYDKHSDSLKVIKASLSNVNVEEVRANQMTLIDKKTWQSYVTEHIEEEK